MVLVADEIIIQGHLVNSVNPLHLLCARTEVVPEC
jgi:hypothetical protein